MSGLTPVIDTSPLGMVEGKTEPRWKRWYPPAFAALLLTSWLIEQGIIDLRNTGGVTRAVNAGRGELTGPVVLALLVMVIVAEQRWPAVRRPLLARGQVQDGLYLLLYAVAVVPLVVVIGVGFSGVVRHLAPWLVLPHATFLPRWAAIGLGLVAIDAGNWAAHWANHRITALWRLHALHHSQEEMSILTAFRTHPLVHTSFLISVLPAVALLANAVLPPTAIVVYLCLATFPHANLRWNFGPVGRVIVNPAYHRLHHARAGRTVNLGTVLTVWDILAGTAVFPVVGAPAIDTGLAGRPVPVEQQGETLQPIGALVTQLAEPFVNRWATTNEMRSMA